MSMPLSILEIVQACNCVASVESLLQSEDYYRFEIGGKLVGLVSADDITTLQIACSKSELPVFEFDTQAKAFTFSQWCGDRQSRSDAVAVLLSQMRTTGAWASLAKWRNELYPVYGESDDNEGIAVMIERAASYNFGIRTFGVHVNGITKSESGEVKMWVARRAMTKQTWPGYLDQIVAGGIGNGMGVWESVIKECAEEGGIPENIAQTATQGGMIQYFTRSELGLQPETEFVFDLVLPEGFVPHPTDGEVDEFYLWTLDEVVEKLCLDLFKPNCAVCIVDFLIRHGRLTPENEPDYIEIVENIHCPLPFPAPKYPLKR
ncbi:hypothetical protein LPJ66_003003 [Kickxella alabastrina]|uniref:Uncharacterized protein n=1 Tax=Kickxella alabastrina TaxID=61397 RepID=A0ACC1INZ1_9FUNG|nr:hypothetical protein LPJ66_003003 [Kickxella alabastrina]